MFHRANRQLAIGNQKSLTLFKSVTVEIGSIGPIGNWQSEIGNVSSGQSAIGNRQSAIKNVLQCFNHKESYIVAGALTLCPGYDFTLQAANQIARRQLG